MTFRNQLKKEQTVGSCNTAFFSMWEPHGSDYALSKLQGVSTYITKICTEDYLKDFKSMPVFDHLNYRQLLKDPLCIMDLVLFLN
jgi:hypothetical protein